MKYEQRFARAPRLLLICFVAFGGVAESGFAAPILGPMDVKGGLGYNYRSLNEKGGSTDTSHQMTANVSSNTYIVEPWLATANMSLSFTQDSSESSGGTSDATTDSQIVTGDLGVNVLSQSKTPLNVQLQLSDSRVDRSGAGMIPITFVDQEYSSTYLGLNQSYITDNGGRYRAFVDKRTWESESGGEYEDLSYGVDMDWRRPRQHVVARATQQLNEHKLGGSENESLILDFNHYWYPGRELRVDTKASEYDYERTFVDPLSNSTSLADYYVRQASSNVFWRPEGSAWTVSGGARYSEMDGAQAGVASNDQMQLALNVGAFYQLSKRVRLDAGATSTFRQTAELDEAFHRQQAGAHYQSDWIALKQFTYQAYSSGRLANVAEPDSTIDADTEDENYIEWNAGVGHNLSRIWWFGERTTPVTLRLNINQALRFSDSGAQTNTLGGVQRLDHSVTSAYYNKIWQGDVMLQVTISDSRNLGGTTDEQQMIHGQVAIDQNIGRRSSIAGDVTVQYVRSDSGGVEVDTTTSTGSVEYSHSSVFGIPRLMFSTDYMVSMISSDELIDREDWDNRLNYRIGKLDSSISYRLTKTDSREYSLLYFRAMRRF